MTVGALRVCMPGTRALSNPRQQIGFMSCEMFTSLLFHTLPLVRERKKRGVES